MEIISELKDYYDSAKIKGSESIIFERKTVENWLDKAEAYQDLGDIHELNIVYPAGTYMPGFAIASRYTFFCGKLYKSIDIYSGTEGVNSFFDFRAFDLYLSKNIRKVDVFVQRYNERKGSDHTLKFAKSAFEKYFRDQEVGVDINRLHEQFGAPIISYGFMSCLEDELCVSRGKPNSVVLRSLNPILSIYGFEKVLKAKNAKQQVFEFLKNKKG